ncbi:hypothetical protein KPH14_001038, partial [Odynerus spinipes]
KHKHSTIHAISKFTSDLCWARNAGYIPPEAFIYLDNAGLIQNDIDHRDMKFRHNLTDFDKKDKHRNNTKKYWWLQ